MTAQPASARDWLVHQAFVPVVEPGHLPIRWINRMLSPEVKQPRRDFDFLPPSVSGVKNERIYNSAPLCDLITDSVYHAVLIVGLKPLGY
jgi:hypothetical protein